MKRSDRLDALIDELRSVAPQPRTAGQLAERFAVSTRTIERDVLDLQRAGVPIWARPGPMGGYTIDAGDALPALDLTLAEAAALAVALSRGATTPYAPAARSARAKLVAALSASAVEGARDLGTRLALLPAPDPMAPGVARIVEQAVLDRQALLLRAGGDPPVEVDPLALAGGDPHWYLVAWCPATASARTFRLDRVTAVHPAGRTLAGGLPLDGARFTDLVRNPAAHESGPGIAPPK